MDKREWIDRLVKARWHIERIERDRVLVKCPARGCDVACWMRPGQAPRACDPRQDRLPSDIPICSYSDLMGELKSRRLNLGLTLQDVDTIAGWADRYTSKVESPGYQKSPGLPALIDWAAALGYELVLRPVGLPKIAQGIISEKAFPSE